MLVEKSKMNPKLIKKAYCERKIAIMNKRTNNKLKTVIDEFVKEYKEELQDAKLIKPRYVKIEKFDLDFLNFNWKGICVVGGKTIREGKVVDE